MHGYIPIHNLSGENMYKNQDIESELFDIAYRHT